MKPDEIARLRKLANSVNGLPWRNAGTAIFDNCLYAESRHPSKNACVANANDWNGSSRAIVETEYIVAACNALPGLLDEIERLQHELDEANTPRAYW